MKKALVVGGDSVIGNALSGELIAAGWQIFATTRNPKKVGRNFFFLDLASAGNFSLNFAPDVVFLCAGITQMATCQAHPELTYLVNVNAPVELAQYFLSKGCYVVFLSTSAVFDGKKPYYQLDDAPCPLTLYGESKALAEKKLLAMNHPALSVIRLTKVLTPTYALFLTWIQALRRGSIVAPFFDLYLSPISLELVTICLRELADKKISGLLHLSGAYDVSYHAVALYLAYFIGANSNLVRGRSALDGGFRPEMLPSFASLDITRTKELLSVADVDLSPFTILSNLYHL